MVVGWGGDNCWVAGRGQGVLWGPAAGYCDGESCPHVAAWLWASPGEEETTPSHQSTLPHSTASPVVPILLLGQSNPQAPHPAQGHSPPPRDPPLPLRWYPSAALSFGSCCPLHGPRDRDGGAPLPQSPCPATTRLGGALAAGRERTGGGRNRPFLLRGKRGDFQPKHPGAQQPHTFPASLPSFIPEDIGDQTQVGPISCSCSEVIELCL